MDQITILRIALPTPLRRLFDYLAPAQVIDPKALIPGVRVRVPFQSRELIGVLIEVAQESDVPYEKLKSAYEILDQAPILTEDIFKLCHWAADYYHYALGEVVMSALPGFLRKGKPAEIKIKNKIKEFKSDIIPQLNDAQQESINAISAAKDNFRVFLLDGVTGSGKTEVYLRVIDEMLKANKQVLVLVPEISLTPQTIQRFQARFNTPIATLHSNLSEKARLSAWLSARSGEAKIVIGTRSAIFTPFANLGLVIVDEEHDTSFKQQERFRYHARDLAIMRASMLQIPIVLGSATPSLESLLNAKRERFSYLSLPERAGKSQLPQFELIDLRQVESEDGVSFPLLERIKIHLENNNQVMLFLNRRGFAPVLYCSQCTWIAECKRCDARLTFHRSPPRLQCHHCDARVSVPKKCAQCGDNNLQPIGVGTQRLEQTLAKHFPNVPLIRIDRDSTRRKGAMQSLLEQVHTTEKAILLGTQMIAKGHHFPQVTLVGVIDADSGLFSADFRAAEQMGQLLLQVAGRAGREEKPGTVLVQTRYPDHPLLQTLIHQGYYAFSQTLLAEREQALLPPFSYFAVFRAEAYEEKNANKFLDAIKEMSSAFAGLVTVLGPVPTIVSKKKGLHCQHLLVKADKRSSMQQFLKGILQQLEQLPKSQPVKWILDVDPLEVV